MFAGLILSVWPDGPHRAAVGQPGHARPRICPTSSPKSPRARRRHPRDLEQADILVTAAPAELGDHTKALADAARILNRTGAKLDMHQAASTRPTSASTTATSELQEAADALLVDTAVKIGAKTVLLPECGHATARRAGRRPLVRPPALPVRIIHMTEFSTS